MSRLQRDLRRERRILWFVIGGGSGYLVLLLLILFVTSSVDTSQVDTRPVSVSQAPPASAAAEFLAFARTCGRYLRDGQFNHVLALTAPTPQLHEYRDSLVLLVTTAVLAGEGRRTYAEVLQVYGRYDRAVIPLGNLYTQLVAAGCWPETAIGEAYEAIKQAARAARDRNR